MKATIDFEETLYRRLKIEAARRGGTIRELVQEGVRYVLDLPPSAALDQPKAERAWFASLREYAANANGAHDLPAIRRSIARKRRSDAPHLRPRRRPPSRRQIAR